MMNPNFHAIDSDYSNLDTQSLALFDREAFIERALAWGHTPLRNLPEQAEVRGQMVERIKQDAPVGTNPLIMEYMSTVYQNRFYVRQERNQQAYASRLNRAAYQSLSSDVRLRRDKAMISAASYSESIQLQDDLETGSIEIARYTHPFSEAATECDVVRDEILEACLEHDPDTIIPATKDRWKIRGSDVISLRGKEYDPTRQVGALFVTKKTDLAYMPAKDTMVEERHTYILDLDAFAVHEPRVTALLRSYDVHELGPAAWIEKVTKMWRDIDAHQPLVTVQNRDCLLDLSTTFYTVNQTRLTLIAERDERSKPLVDVPRLALLEQEDDFDRERQIEAEANRLT